MVEAAALVAAMPLVKTPEIQAMVEEEPRGTTVAGRTWAEGADRTTAAVETTAAGGTTEAGGTMEAATEEVRPEFSLHSSAPLALAATFTHGPALCGSKSVCLSASLALSATLDLGGAMLGISLDLHTQVP